MIIKSVLIEITNLCNLQCAHCFNISDRQREHTSVSMSLHQIKQIIDKCYAYGVKKIYLSGGEPFCHPRIIEILDMCKSYSDVFFIITTNGLLISDFYLNTIEKCQNIGVQLSVDSFTQETYEKQRGSGAFGLFKTNYELFKKSNITFKSARTCVTRYNYSEIETIYRSLISNGIVPSFILVNKFGNAEKNWNNISLSLAQKIKTIDVIQKLNKEFNEAISVPEPVSMCNFTERVGIKSLLIKYDGNIAPCQYFYSDSIGNIFEEDINSIMNPMKLKKYYDQAEHRKKELIAGQCKSCVIKDYCSLGCLGLSLLDENNDKTDGQCDFRRAVIAMYCSGMIPFVTHEPHNQPL